MEYCHNTLVWWMSDLHWFAHVIIQDKENVYFEHIYSLCMSTPMFLKPELTICVTHRNWQPTRLLDTWEDIYPTWSKLSMKLEVPTVGPHTLYISRNMNAMEACQTFEWFMFLTPTSFNKSRNCFNTNMMTCVRGHTHSRTPILNWSLGPKVNEYWP